LGHRLALSALDQPPDTSPPQTRNVARTGTLSEQLSRWERPRAAYDGGAAGRDATPAPPKAAPEYRGALDARTAHRHPPVRRSDPDTSPRFASRCAARQRDCAK